MLERVLETEVMDTAQDAAEYNAIDNSEVNREFARDALSLCSHARHILDLGTGPALIPIQLALTSPQVRITGVDMAEHMLILAKRNVAAAGLSDRIRLERRDVKQTDFAPASFHLIVCNSLVHHLPDPVPMFQEIARLMGPTTRLLIKDLIRPTTESELATLVSTYAAEDTDYQRQLFADSLRAALTIPEVIAACEQAELGPVTVERTSDRHYRVTRCIG